MPPEKRRFCSWCGEPAVASGLEIGAAVPVDVCEKHQRMVERERAVKEADRERRQKARRQARA